MSDAIPAEISMTWKDAILTFSTSLRHSEHYALFGNDSGSILTGSCWPKKYPNSDRKGIYLILSKADVPLYIGMTAKQRIGNRLGKYFGTDSKTKGCRVKAPIAPVGWKGSGHFPGWCQCPTYIVTVAVPDNEGDTASALEKFLIDRLQPCCNVVGIR